MEELNIKDNLSQNLIFLRKNQKLTQGEFAEKINYSDKTVSKWENGDAIPDVETLYLIAKFYGVTLDALISDNLQKMVVTDKSKTNKQHVNKIIITLLSVLLVWLIAVVAHIQINLVFKLNLWILYILALPISMVVLLVFNCIWGRRHLTFIILSFLNWFTLLYIHLQLLNINNMWSIYFIGIPLQIAIILWSQLKK
jgi:transcriptional regulator with XRE-family HTH domain